jgi:hypothetical protein
MNNGWSWIYPYRFRLQGVLPILSHTLGRLPWLPQIVIIALAIGLTLVSLRYVHPAFCQYLCTTESCPPGYCRFGEQGAGFPFPVIIDNEAGSPLSGLGKVGPEDIPNPLTFVLDVLFYSGILWLLWQALLWMRRLPEPYFVVVLACLVCPLIFGVALMYPPGLWWLIPHPPIPVSYMPSQVYYSADDTKRMTEFEIDQSTDSIRRFYATELPKDGWRYACSLGLMGRATMVIWTYQVKPPCSLLTFTPGVEMIDVYQRDKSRGRTQLLGILFFEERTLYGSDDRRRLVWLQEFR